MPSRAVAPSLASAAVLAVGVAVAGCGSAATTRSRTGGRLFAAACAACHTIDGREDPRRQGGDLLHLRIGAAALREFTTEMPVPHRLSATQVSRIDAYVLALERR